MSNLAIKRRFVRDSVPLESVLGKKFQFPDTDMVLLEAVASGRSRGWKKDELRGQQAGSDFTFDGQLFRQYVSRVLPRQVNSIYFPAAYVGKVAFALHKAGFDVSASDLSIDWFFHLSTLGLRSSIVSFEDFSQVDAQNKKFDALVCFEPIPVSTLSMFLGLLGSFSRSMMFVELSRTVYSLIHFDDRNMRLLSKDGKFVKGRLPSDQFVYANSPSDFSRLSNPCMLYPTVLGYHYGARFHGHVVRQDEHVFIFYTCIPDVATVERAKLDLKLVGLINNQFESLSVSKFANICGVSKEMISAALLRLFEVFGIMMSKFDLERARTLKLDP